MACEVVSAVQMGVPWAHTCPQSARGLGPVSIGLEQDPWGLGLRRVP